MLTQQQLLTIMQYDPATGIARWKDGRSKKSRDHRVGSLQGGKRCGTYRYVRLAEAGEGKKPFSHIVYFYMTGSWPPEEIDHINGDTLDDRWINLRPCTRAQNEANRGARKNNKLGCKGVIFKNDRYYAKFWRGKHINVGCFPTLEEAKMAHSAAVMAYDGEYFRS